MFLACAGRLLDMGESLQRHPFPAVSFLEGSPSVLGFGLHSIRIGRLASAVRLCDDRTGRGCCTCVLRRAMALASGWF